MDGTSYEVTTISDFLAAWLAGRPLGPSGQKQVDDYYANFRGMFIKVALALVNARRGTPAD